MTFTLRQRYTRQQIHDAIGGDLQSYLPHRDGRVVCGCFDYLLNAKAPFEIDVGNLPEVIKYAERVVAQGETIPVFLKRGSSEWEYAGRFSPVKLERSPADLYPLNSHRRPDAVAVLYFDEERFETVGERIEEYPPDIEATEGEQLMRTHLWRERSPVLAAAKRRAFRLEHRLLRCEVCSISESDLPDELAEACFEVHHLLPLASLSGPTRTGLVDLALLCANCHRMLHRSNPMLRPDALSAKLRKDA